MKRSDFKLEPELKGMKVADIKKHVRAFNKHYAIQGYSKLKKNELVSAILSAQMRLGGAKKTKKKLKLVIEEPAKKASPVAKKASPVLTEFYFDERPYLKDADDNIYDRKTRKKISTLAILKKKLAEHTAERRRLFEIRQKEKVTANKGKKKQKSQTLEEVKANLAKSTGQKIFKAADEMIAGKKAKLTSNRQVVQALLDGAIHLLNIDHINEVENDSTARMLGVETISERKELLKKFQDSPALSKKLLAYDFFRFGRVRKQVGIQKIPLNLFKEINENMKLIEEKLQTELGRDTATGKLKTLETSTRPKAVRDLKEYLALPLWKKVEEAVTKYDYGDDNKTGFQFLRAMIELV